MNLVIAIIVFIWIFLIILLLWVIDGIKKIYKSQTNKKISDNSPAPYPVFFAESLSASQCINDSRQSDMGRGVDGFESKNIKDYDC